MCMGAAGRSAVSKVCMARSCVKSGCADAVEAVASSLGMDKECLILLMISQVGDFNFALCCTCRVIGFWKGCQAHNLLSLDHVGIIR
jgi:hypothetical protein